jgi:D-amino peptidase
MKFFISVDMEGVGGVASNYTMTKDDSFCRELITAEVNAVIDGILKAVKSPKEILVCDSHNEGENILFEKLNPKATLLRGYPRHHYMMTGIDNSYSLLFLVGYHSRSGEGAAVLDHTFSGQRIQKVEINGREVGEFDLSAGLAAQYNVPVGFASGDDKLEKQVKEVAPWVKTAVTKHGISRYAAKMIHPSKVRDLLKAKAYEACKDIKKMKPLKFHYPLATSVDFANTALADLASMIPMVKRVGGKNIKFESQNFSDFYNLFSAIATIVHSIK